MRIVISESQFKKDLKLAGRQNKDINQLLEIVEALRHEKPLPPKNKNHKLKGKYTGYWECHVEPDWLLVYKLVPGKLILSRIASHAELF